MLPTHFIADALPNRDGYTWTLTTRLGAILQEVEQSYGPRDHSWTVLGVEFGPDTPRLWYPGNRRHVAIQLATNALENNSIACYQLAHECVHLLSPSGGSSVPALEEGLATVFSEEYVKREFQLLNPTDLDSYIEAASFTRQLLAIDADAILKLRIVEPSFKELTSDTFVHAGVCVSEELIAKLLEPFER